MAELVRGFGDESDRFSFTQHDRHSVDGKRRGSFRKFQLDKLCEL
jgi:hypothetical protein